MRAMRDAQSALTRNLAYLRWSFAPSTQRNKWTEALAGNKWAQMPIKFVIYDRTVSFSHLLLNGNILQHRYSSMYGILLDYIDLSLDQYH